MTTWTRRLSSGLFVAATALAGCGSDDPSAPAGLEESTFVTAAVGDTVRHSSGARLIVPPGALSRDATVSIVDLGVGPIQAWNPMVRVSPRFVFDLGGATAIADMTVELDYAAVGAVGAPGAPPGVLLAGRDADGNVRLMTADADPAEPVIRRAVRDELNQVAAPLRTFEAVHVPDVTLGTPPEILDVHYYYQGALPWCVPTSLAMALNYYDQGLFANYSLAGADHQDANSGNAYVDLMAAAGFPENTYTYLCWDADLIPGNPFTNYVKLVTRGYNLQDLYGTKLVLNGKVIPVPDVDIPPRAPALSSTVTDHAFMGAGADDAAIWLHDSSGAFTGNASIAERLTWGEFRAIAVDQAASDEVRSLIVFKNPRPVAERHGSLVLYFGLTGAASYREGGAVGYGSHWTWDGDPYTNGYYWSDPGNHFPDDPTYGNKLVLGPAPEYGLPGEFYYSFWVANVTSTSRDFLVTLQLRAGDTVYGLRRHTVTVPPLDWKSTFVTGTLDDDTPLPVPGGYTLEYQLFENGVLQDRKTIEFVVAGSQI